MRIRVGVLAVVSLAWGISSTLFAQDIDPGRTAFESRCARCHGADGNGGEIGPPIGKLTPLEDEQLIKTIATGSSQGCPRHRRDDGQLVVPPHDPAARRRVR
jgi:cytochrome c553